MIKYLKGIFLITIVFFAMVFFKAYMPWQVHPNFSGIIIFFFFQSLAIAALLTYGEKFPDRFGFIALGAVVIRLISAMIYLGFEYLTGVEQATLFASQLMMVYLSYLAFELSMVLTNLRQN